MGKLIKSSFQYSPNPREEATLQASKHYMLQSQPVDKRGNRPTPFGMERQAFGSQMDSESFKKGLRKMQEDLRITQQT